jgi:putative oxidoreductase
MNRYTMASAGDMFVALVTAHIDEGFFAADGGIELVLLLGGASLAVLLTGAARFSADAALDLPRPFQKVTT